MHPDGRHKATIAEAGLRQDKNGETKPFIRFQTEHGEITWFGNLKSEKSQEFAVKQMVTAGFIGSDFSDLTDKPKEVIFAPQEMTIQVTHEEYNGKKHAKIAFINKENERKEFTGVAPKMGALFAKVRQDMGVTAKPVDSFPF